MKSIFVSTILFKFIIQFIWENIIKNLIVVHACMRANKLINLIDCMVRLQATKRRCKVESSEEGSTTSDETEDSDRHNPRSKVCD